MDSWFLILDIMWIIGIGQLQSRKFFFTFELKQKLILNPILFKHNYFALKQLLDGMGL